MPGPSKTYWLLPLHEDSAEEIVDGEAGAPLLPYGAIVDPHCVQLLEGIDPDGIPPMAPACVQFVPRTGARMPVHSCCCARDKGVRLLIVKTIKRKARVRFKRSSFKRQLERELLFKFANSRPREWRGASYAR